MRRRKRKKWILHPGRRLSDNKFFSARHLAHLYGVPLSECHTISHVIKHPESDLRGMIHLFVREDDNYKLPEDKS